MRKRNVPGEEAAPLDKRLRALPLPARIALVVAIAASYILWAALWMYRWQRRGVLLSVSRASEDIPGILGQNVVVSLSALLLFALAGAVLKERFVREMDLSVRGRGQWIGVLAAAAVLLFLAVWCLITKKDTLTAIYALFYYLLVVAFVEELLFHGVCPYLLENESGLVRILVPNLADAAIHLFSHSNWGAITGPDVLRFALAEVLPLAGIGCLMQVIKERSGTIWISVLLHAIMDYRAVLSWPI